MVELGIAPKLVHFPFLPGVFFCLYGFDVIKDMQSFINKHTID
jgi:hypothetical protein